ncbi:hypothetical protein F5Y17DRAFT_459869 [Xylariaceae sp. FL0594]|nr:hypothetical protein F5Y17DRAFT_459869 [Xylariaceae sp. FL0594]
MQTKIFTAALFFAVLGATQDVDVDDFPRACHDVCRPISRLSTECGDRTDNNTDERNCLCNAENAEQQATDCAACFKATDPDDSDDGDDLGDIFELCGWDYYHVAPAFPTTSSSVVVVTSTVPGTTTTGLESGTAVTSTIEPTTFTTTTTTPASPTNTGNDADDDDHNAAAGLSACLGLLVAGFFAAI